MTSVAIYNKPGDWRIVMTRRGVPIARPPGYRTVKPRSRSRHRDTSILIGIVKVAPEFRP